MALESPLAPVGPSFVVEYAAQRLIACCVVVVAVATLLTQTSSRFWLNLPLAAVVVGASIWVMALQRTSEAPNSCKSAAGSSWRSKQSGGLTSGMWRSPAPKPDGTRWREKVQAPVVEQAWETLCGSIIQEFVYDAWFGSMTPDREFPAEIRRALNCAFGELASQSRSVDLRAVLRDLSELVIDTLELFRDTRDSIVSASGGNFDKSGAAWDRALQREMRADGNLHPAFCTPDGHYKVQKSVAEGLAVLLLDRSDSSKAMARSIAREMLASAVLRNIMFFFTPYTINKALLGLLRKQPKAETKAIPDLEEDQRRVFTAAKGDTMRGHWVYEQRLRASVESEGAARAQERASKRKARTRLATLPCSDTGIQAGGSGQQMPADSSSSRDAAVRMPPPATTQTQTPTASNGTGDPASLGVAGAASQALRGGSQEAFSETRALSKASANKSSFATSNNQEAAATPSSLASSPLPFVTPRAPTDATPSASAVPPSTEGNAAAGASAAGGAGGGVPHVTPGSSCAQHSQQQGVPSRADQDDIIDADCFVGRPMAKVVAAELTAEGGKEVVMFIIRVADDRGEWTIARRFRHFETLHRSMRVHKEYKARLPPKRIFFYTATVDFVEERRQQLDIHMGSLLNDPNLCRTNEVWQFLSPWSESYSLQDDGSFLRAVTAQIGTAKFNVQRFAGDIANDLDTKRKRSVAVIARTLAPPPDLPPGVVLQGRSSSAKAPQCGSSSAKSVSSSGGHVNSIVKRRNSHSPIRGEEAVSTRMDSISYDSRCSRSNGPMPGFGAKGGGTPCMRPDSSAPLARSRSSAALRDEVAAAAAAARIAAKATVLPAGAILGGTTQRRRHTSSTVAPACHVHIEGILLPQLGEQAGGGVLLGTPSCGTSAGGDSEGEDSERDLPCSDGDGGHLEVAPRTSSASALQAVTTDAALRAPRQDSAVGAGSGEDDSAGVSAPLYDVVDAIFGLAGRGFFRRQIFSVARQALSLVAGGAIDVFLAGQLRLLRQEHTLARAIHGVQAALWPGGVWFMQRPEYRKKPPKTAAESAMSAENFMTEDSPPPVDAEEIREAVAAALQALAPPALVSLIGKPAYTSGVQDVFDMLQSPTFVMQLGYGALEVVTVSAFVDLKPLFQQMHHHCA